MHDIRFIRQNPDAFDAAMVRRGLAPVSEEILRRDKEKRSSKTELQLLQQEANAAARKIGELKQKGEDADAYMEKSKTLKAQIHALKEAIEQGEEDISTELVDELLATLPNIPDADVPDGESEEDNKEIRRQGEWPTFSFKPKEHFEIGENLGLMDSTQTAKISGARFTTLKGDLARLERALAQFMLDTHTQEFGYTLVSPPLLVRDEAMFGSGQLPKFAEDSFLTTNGYRLIPTSEVSLVNLVRENILAEEELPLRLVAHTPCFRSEAGSAGKDTRGMIRQHQFWKVELISITTPEQSKKEHERMTSHAEAILQRLELPYRVVSLCTADLGFGARKTYDLEVWLPGQHKYREISSCSNCGDFQARRMKSRFRRGEENLFVHTLNGSGLAVGRTLIAVLENYQQEDGSVVIPHALRPYMGNQERIEKQG